MKSPTSFTIGDTSSFSPYTGEGFVEQVKVPVNISFKSLSESLIAPVAPGKDQLDECDFDKLGRPVQLHFLFRGLLQFIQKNNGTIDFFLNKRSITLVE